MYSLQALGTRLPEMTAPWFAPTGSGPVNGLFKQRLEGPVGWPQFQLSLCQYSQLPDNILVVSGARY